MTHEKIIHEYPEEYCDMLELAYGENMMSEGGAHAIDDMFNGINLAQKKCLDIGFGLAGAAMYLAKKYRAQVTGLEINPRMVSEANKKVHDQTKTLLNFLTYHDFPKIPCFDDEFDVVYSKGVLVHLQDKQSTFHEIFRTLKPHGHLVIDDWLSSSDHGWSKRVEKISEIENLSLFPTSKKTYTHLLEQAGFKMIQMDDVSQKYSAYNFQIANRLQHAENKLLFIKKFGEQLWSDSIEAYRQIAEAMQQNEIIVMNIRAVK